MISCVCKYTPLELFAGFGEECAVDDSMSLDFDLSDNAAHVNLCGFGKTVIQRALAGKTPELVLVNCCDTMRRAYEVIKAAGTCSFIHLLDLPHVDGPCQRKAFAAALTRLRDEYAEASGRTFDLGACQRSFERRMEPEGPYIGILGVRVGRELEGLVDEAFALPVRNLTCTGNRDIALGAKALGTDDEDLFFSSYAAALLGQLPCCRMNDPSGRRRLSEDPRLRAVIYHSIKFCDFYGLEYAEMKNRITVPLLKMESDFTLQSKEQLRTRIEAFAETTQAPSRKVAGKIREDGFAVGIDSGSTSTDVVIMDRRRTIVASAVIPTGGGARASAEKSLAIALDRAGIDACEVDRIVATGYGRSYLDAGDASITEISCHAKGARFLNPEARTVIDIGGQDNKVIDIDEDGSVRNFAMNDKCAAGTGRFLEMMARALDLSLDEMGEAGLSWREKVPISSMCTVFAESEVVSLVAQNKAVPDIVHGLDDSVAAKIATLSARVGGGRPYMMTGGVAKNAGVVRAIEERLGEPIFICEEAQLCGAIGAALFALEDEGIV